MKSHGLLEHLNCQECNQEFSNLRTAKSHYYEKHTLDKNEKNFKCEFCPYKTHIKRYLADHSYRRHKIPFKISSKKYAIAIKQEDADGHFKNKDCPKIVQDYSDDEIEVINTPAKPPPLIVDILEDED